MTSLDILTPLASGAAVELGNRVWRKQVLPLGSIAYGDRTLNFDAAYLRNVAQAFRDQAFDTVPFVLADADNRHTMDPERARGEVLGMEVDADGLYATVRLSESAEQLVRDNPRLGVSVRVKENYDRPDGRSFPAACQHVLGTFDPKVTGMGPWSSVELSHAPGIAVVDLSALTYTEKEADMAKTETQTAPQTPEELFAKFRAWMDAGQPAPGAADTDDDPNEPDPDAGEGEEGGQGDADPDDDPEMTDAEFEAAMAGIVWDDPAEPADKQLVTASNDDDGALDLAQVARDERLSAVELANRELRTKLDAAEYEKERGQLVRLSGLPPADVDIARPLLEGTGRTVELANGEGTVDAGEIVRKLLKRFGDTVRLLDLSAEIGQGLDVVDDVETAAETRKARAAEFAAGIPG